MRRGFHPSLRATCTRPPTRQAKGRREYTKFTGISESNNDHYGCRVLPRGAMLEHAFRPAAPPPGTWLRVISSTGRRTRPCSSRRTWRRPKTRRATKRLPPYRKIFLYTPCNFHPGSPGSFYPSTPVSLFPGNYPVDTGVVTGVNILLLCGSISIPAALLLTTIFLGMCLRIDRLYHGSSQGCEPRWRCTAKATPSSSRAASPGRVVRVAGVWEQLAPLGQRERQDSGPAHIMSRARQEGEPHRHALFGN